MQKQRPKHLDLARIRLPVPGFVSILHRVSGVALFFSLPLLIYLLHGSLSSASANQNSNRANGSVAVSMSIVRQSCWGPMKI